ncbi:MAG: serine hydrolase domain-containing protein [Bacteroidota bacterium]
MKWTNLFLTAFVLLQIACATENKQLTEISDSPQDSETKNLNLEIAAIENSLIKEYYVTGQPLEQFSLSERMAHYNVPGVSVAVVIDGKVRWQKTYGVADNASKKLLNDKTLFQAASISKPVSALAILKLVQEDKIDLDKDVNTYLKDWKLTSAENLPNATATIRQLLTHSAGTNVNGFGGYEQEEYMPTTREILNGDGKSERLKIVRKPGGKWDYSGGGYVLLQKVVEDVSGQPFAQYMQNEVLQPLDMEASTFTHPIDEQQYTNVSSGHDMEGKVISGKWNNFPELGAGGLWTNPTDLAKYCLYVQNVMAGQKGFLKKETLEQMLIKHGDRDWGLGPFLTGEGNNLIFTHDGSNKGYRADFLSYAYQGNAAVVMTNSDSGGELAEELMRAITTYYKWETRQQEVITPPDLSKEHLQSLAGTYSWDKRSQYMVEVQVIKDDLWFVFPDDNGLEQLELIAKDEHHFLHLDSGTTIDFTPSSDNTVNKLKWRGRFEFSRVEK